MFENDCAQTAASPTVSCIIIFYNEERFLSEAIQSVIAQTYTDWELLLVDDGSTDRSPSIGQDYAALYPGRIHYLTHEKRANRGMSASRNLGIKRSRGRFIAFLDGDDVWLESKLAEQLNLFKRNPEAVMICGATEYWFSWDPNNILGHDRIVPSGEISPGTAIAQDVLVFPPQLMKHLYPLGKGASPSTSGFMITRDLIQAIGGFEDAFRTLYEDQAFKIKVYLQGPIYISSICFDRYRQHADSCVYVGNATGVHDEARITFLRWLTNYLSEVNCHDRDIRLRLTRALLRYDHPTLHALATTFKGFVRRFVQKVSF